MSTGVAGILLAAGGGSRLGRPKALVELGGQTLAARGAGLLRTGGADPIIVVTGAAPVGLPGVTQVHNPNWRTGMGSSLVAGLSALRDTPPDSCRAAVIALADQPLVGAESVRRLIAAHAAGATVAVAAYDGRPRNPVLIDRTHWDEVLATTEGDAGARPFLRAHPDLVTAVECADTGRPDDIDTPEDLARALSLIEKTLCRSWMTGRSSSKCIEQRTANICDVDYSDQTGVVDDRQVPEAASNHGVRRVPDACRRLDDAQASGHQFIDPDGIWVPPIGHQLDKVRLRDEACRLIGLCVHEHESGHTLIPHEVCGRGHVVVPFYRRHRRPHDVGDVGRGRRRRHGRLLRRGVCHDLLRFRGSRLDPLAI
jgi:nicotine blue oxidoreductase